MIVDIVINTANKLLWSQTLKLSQSGETFAFDIPHDVTVMMQEAIFPTLVISTREEEEETK